jgi:hypothetical protein
VTYTALSFLILALASYRLTRVVTDDTITDAARAWVWRRAYIVSAYDSERDQETTMTRSVAWSWLYRLVSCPFCVGWWVSLACYWAWWYSAWAWMRPALSAVAVAGGQAFISSRRDA